uniref:Uncharacterized protein n=1 Tax=Meloidogyne incognita TaxID=6306 RepID=A0A914M882_MELIC
MSTSKNSQCRRPFMLKNVQTNASLIVNIWMVYLCFEANLWGFKRIILGEVDV